MGRIFDRGHDGGDKWRWQTISEWVNENGWTRGAELGTWEGHTFKNLILSCPNLTLIGVDLYESQPDNTGPERWTPGENSHAWDHNQYYNNIMHFCEQNRPRAMFHKGYTTEVANLIEDDSLDFVFIDADHSYEGVVKDIAAWAPKVKSGGYIIGHDIHFESVKKAVEEKYGQNYSTADDFVWYVVKE